MGVRIREQLADIPQGAGSQHGVHGGMGEGVRIGMSQQPQMKGDGYPAQYQGPAFHQPVGILPIAEA